LDDNQVDDLLQRVNMNNSFLDLANTDQELITLMKNTIEFQRGVMKKRETMVHAITHNVKYLADIHKRNNCTMKETQDRNERLIRQNEELKVKNKKLEEENTELLADQKELERKRN
jgi:hypothetical protein